MTDASAPRSTQDSLGPAICAADRHRMIAEAAYYLARQRDFAPGHETQDWYRAADFIEGLIADGTLGRAGGDRQRLRNALRLWVD